jgi:Cu/Ag efflux protein CusF
MKIFSRCWSVVAILSLFVAVVGLQATLAQEDAVHIFSGVVKHVDKDAKTIVVKADDGAEHTVKWTDKTTWEATKESGKGIKEGSKVSVKYTEKAGEKTAVGVKDIGKDTGKALQ